MLLITFRASERHRPWLGEHRNLRVCVNNLSKVDALTAGRPALEQNASRSLAQRLHLFSTTPHQQFHPEHRPSASPYRYTSCTITPYCGIIYVVETDGDEYRFLPYFNFSFISSSCSCTVGLGGAVVVSFVSQIARPISVMHRTTTNITRPPHTAAMFHR